MNRPEHILKNTVALSVARLAEKAVSICVSFVIARKLGPSALGVYSAAIVFFGVISIAADMGCATFLVRETARHPSRTGLYLVHLGAVTVGAASLLMCGAWIVLPHLDYSSELLASAYVMSFTAIPGCLRALAEAALVAHQRVECITVATVCASVFTLTASIAALQSGLGSVALVVIFAAVQTFLAIGYLVWLNARVCSLRMKLQTRMIVELIGQLRAFAGTSVLGGLLARPEVLLLSVLRSDAQIGYYTAALRVVDFWGILPDTYMRNVFPLLSRSFRGGDKDAGRRLVLNAARYLLALGVPLMFGIAIAAEPIVRILYGPGFDQAARATRLMAVAIPVAFLLELLWRWLAARDEQHLMFRAQVITTCVRLGGGCLLIAWYGVTGAAISFPLFLFGHCLLLLWYGRKDAEGAPPDILAVFAPPEVRGAARVSAETTGGSVLPEGAFGQSSGSTPG